MKNTSKNLFPLFREICAQCLFTKVIQNTLPLCSYDLQNAICKAKILYTLKAKPWRT